MEGEREMKSREGAREERGMHVRQKVWNMNMRRKVWKVSVRRKVWKMNMRNAREEHMWYNDIENYLTATCETTYSIMIYSLLFVCLWSMYRTMNELFNFLRRLISLYKRIANEQPEVNKEMCVRSVQQTWILSSCSREQFLVLICFTTTKSPVSVFNPLYTVPKPPFPSTSPRDLEFGGSRKKINRKLASCFECWCQHSLAAVTHVLSNLLLVLLASFLLLIFIASLLLLFRIAVRHGRCYAFKNTICVDRWLPGFRQKF